MFNYIIICDNLWKSYLINGHYFENFLLVNELKPYFWKVDFCAKFHRCKSKIVACIVFTKNRYVTFKTNCILHLQTIRNIVVKDFFLNLVIASAIGIFSTKFPVEVALSKCNEL